MRSFLFFLSLTICFQVASWSQELANFDPESLDVGTLQPDAEIASFSVKLTSQVADLQLLRLVSSCECVKIHSEAELPVSITAGQSHTLTVTVDPAKYEGPFRKLLFAQVESQAVGKTKLLRLTVTGAIATDDPWPEEQVPSIPDTEKKAETMIEWNGQPAFQEIRHDLILFLNPSCDKCNWVKLDWLPRQLSSGYTKPIYTVNLEKREGVKLLLECEKTISRAFAPKQDPPDNAAPIALFNNKLYYGTQEIGRIDLFPETSDAEQALEDPVAVPTQ